ncbi:O-antigen ligase family protein [Sphingobacterium multivorum]|uniref:Lipid A core - O-antigen ligase and related enzymes n=1 Tax=Sphingobacterium multivorum TaxID=28454 RepID=A0A2X2J2E7_SPHMU|nr:O-antigen ligase family protein [Sphingobacterium multivorum]QRQ61205.1 O-antigen ligase family protein [Sphingobacterium multivorum]SPZ88472.1 Uncharacterised protein [Sphingobacterium multivorum]
MKQLIRSDKFFLNNNDIYILLLIVPVLTCIQFWYNIILHQNIQIGAYFQLILTFYLYFLIVKKKAFLVLSSLLTFLFLSFFYSAYTNTRINENLSYLIVLHNIILLFLILPSFSYKRVKLVELREFLVYFIIIFMIIFEISSQFASKVIIDEYYGIERNYKDGFVISHLAAYYFGVSAFFLWKFKKRWLSVILCMYILTLGARIGLVYILIGIMVLFLYKVNRQLLNFIWKYRVLIFSSLSFTIFLLIAYSLSSSNMENLMVFTSGRSYFQANGILHILNDGISIDNLIGRGPKASNRLNEQFIGAPIWMHNDFLDIAFNLGVIGLLAYLISTFNYFNNVKSLYLLIILFLTAFLNGFITYDPLYILLLSDICFKKSFKV